MYLLVAFSWYFFFHFVKYVYAPTSMASILQKLQYFFFGHQIERSVNRTEQSPNLYIIIISLVLKQPHDTTEPMRVDVFKRHYGSV